MSPRTKGILQGRLLIIISFSASFMYAAGCISLNMNIFGMLYMYGCLNTTLANNYVHDTFLIHVCNI